MSGKTSDFNVLIVGQSGRLSTQAALFVASLRARDPDFAGEIFVAEPQPGPLWGENDPRLRDDARGVLDRLKATILPLENRFFGQAYAYGNKIEALRLLPDAPFVFFDTDTLICGKLSDVPFDFADPSASQRVSGTWPTPTLYGPSIGEIWASLYERFGLDFESSLDPTKPEMNWQRYLYFNAGWFYHISPKRFGERFCDYALSIRNDPPGTLTGQSLDPWLDQVALPLVIHSFGGGRDRLPAGLLDGSVSCHYRNLSLLYARESDAVIEVLKDVAAPNWIKKVLKTQDAFKRLHFQEKGLKIRAMFDQTNLPPSEKVIRQQIKNAGLWMR